jgi:hypothetical protein
MAQLVNGHWVYCSSCKPAGFFPDNAPAFKDEIEKNYVPIFHATPEYTSVDQISFLLLFIIHNLIFNMVSKGMKIFLVAIFRFLNGVMMIMGCLNMLLNN